MRSRPGRGGHRSMNAATWTHLASVQALRDARPTDGHRHKGTVHHARCGRVGPSQSSTLPPSSVYLNPCKFIQEIGKRSASGRRRTPVVKLPPKCVHVVKAQHCFASWRCFALSTCAHVGATCPSGRVPGFARLTLQRRPGREGRSNGRTERRGAPLNLSIGHNSTRAIARCTLRDVKMTS